jgi:hypothetical protein
VSEFACWLNSHSGRDLLSHPCYTRMGHPDFDQGICGPTTRRRKSIGRTFFSGQNVGDGRMSFLKSIADCVPSAPQFGVPEKNVFKQR